MHTQLKQRLLNAQQQLNEAKAVLKLAQHQLEQVQHEVRRSCVHEFFTLPREPHCSLWVECKHCKLQRMK